MSTSAARNEYRLTPDDEHHITVMLVQVTSTWTPAERQQGARDTLRRVAARSIGCSLSDLRDSEVEWIDGRITRVLVEGH